MNRILLSIFVPILILTGITLVSCDTELEPSPSRAGKLDLRSFIALGDGFTAGFMDGGYYKQGQSFAFPDLISRQFSDIVSIFFRQAWAEGSGSGHLSLDSLHVSACSFLDPIPTIGEKLSDISWKDNISNIGPFNNLGIPDLRVKDIANKRLTLTNPYFRRMIPEGEALSYIDLAVQARPSTFTIWLGNMDFLNYASGAGLDPETLTPLPIFKQNIRALIDTLLVTRESSKGLVGTLPDPSVMPYFHQIGPSFISEEYCREKGFDVYIETGPEGQKSTRLATEEDMILLPALDRLGELDPQNSPFGLSISNPLTDEWVLDQSEAIVLRAQLNRYNTILRELVDSVNVTSSEPRLAIVDLQSTLRSLKEGILLDGLEVNASFISGGIYSLDGIHLTPRGNAFIANAFIEAANERFGANIPTVNITDLPGIRFP